MAAVFFFVFFFLLIKDIINPLEYFVSERTMTIRLQRDGFAASRGEGARIHLIIASPRAFPFARKLGALANYRRLFHLQQGVEYASTKYLNPRCVFIF